MTARVGVLVLIIGKMAFPTRSEVEKITFTGRLGMALPLFGPNSAVIIMCMSQHAPLSKSDLAHYEGLYVISFLALEITAVDGRLLAAMPGVPAGYEMRLSPAGHHSFHAGSGPLKGGTVSFAVPETGGPATAVQVGSYTLARAAALPPDAMYLTPAPDFELDEARAVAFEALLAEMERAGGGEVAYTPAYPLHEFLQYATAAGRYLFHGSNNSDIDEFVPVRRSMELQDATGRGNQAGVYATDDALWALFYAVVARNRLRGAMRNSAVVFHNEAGTPLHLYFFSLHHESLAEAPWTQGALYLLPRDSFRQQTIAPGALTAEWVSLEPVRPLARLAVAPDAFPFHEQVRAHDDTALLQLGTLRRAWLAAVRDVVAMTPEQMTLVLAWDEGVAEALAGYIELQKRYMPAVRYELVETEGEARLTITGPPAYLQVVARAAA